MSIFENLAGQPVDYIKGMDGNPMNCDEFLSEDGVRTMSGLADSVNAQFAPYRQALAAARSAEEEAGLFDPSFRCAAAMRGEDIAAALSDAGLDIGNRDCVRHATINVAEQLTALYAMYHGTDVDTLLVHFDTTVDHGAPDTEERDTDPAPSKDDMIDYTFHDMEDNVTRLHDQMFTQSGKLRNYLNMDPDSIVSRTAMTVIHQLRDLSELGYGNDLDGTERMVRNGPPTAWFQTRTQAQAGDRYRMAADRLRGVDGSGHAGMDAADKGLAL